jgi:hypothetical protein
MKKLMTAVVVLAVMALAGSALAQFGSIKKGGGAVNDLKSGNVTGAASKGLDIAIDTENSECKNQIGQYHQNVQYNTANGGPSKIQAAFPGCKVSNNSESYWRAKCDYKKFNYINASCNKTNCSVYCYKK